MRARKTVWQKRVSEIKEGHEKDPDYWGKRSSETGGAFTARKQDLFWLIRKKALENTPTEIDKEREYLAGQISRGIESDQINRKEYDAVVNKFVDDIRVSRYSDQAFSLKRAFADVFDEAETQALRRLEKKDPKRAAEILRAKLRRLSKG